jgi:hypothetical protein
MHSLEVTIMERPSGDSVGEDCKQQNRYSNGVKRQVGRRREACGGKRHKERVGSCSKEVVIVLEGENVEVARCRDRRNVLEC